MIYTIKTFNVKSFVASTQTLTLSSVRSKMMQNQLSVIFKGKQYVKYNLLLFIAYHKNMQPMCNLSIYHTEQIPTLDLLTEYNNIHNNPRGACTCYRHNYNLIQYNRAVIALIHFILEHVLCNVWMTIMMVCKALIQNIINRENKPQW